VRKIIEYTVISVDGVFEGPHIIGFSEFRDDAYMRDGLGQVLACGAMLMGRNTYDAFSKLWPKRTDPWAQRINAMPKYVFSSTLGRPEWNNSTIISGDVVSEVTKLKQQEGQDLLVYGHGRFAETLLKHGLCDVLDLAVHPIILGKGKQFFREEQSSRMKLISTKSYSKGIVKLTYEPNVQS
jgi:dihydrofolate reductase